MGQETKLLTKRIKELENALQIERQNISFSNAIIESGNLIVWAVNTEFNLVSHNQNYFKYFLPNDKEQEFITKENGELKSTKSTEFWNYYYQKILNGNDISIEVKVKVDDKYEWKSVYLNPVHDNDAQIVAISGVGYDITEKKESRNKLILSEEKFRNIFESFQDLYFKTDFKGFITMLSPSVKDIMGYSSEQLIGKNATNYYIYNIKIKSLLRQLVTEGTIKNVEVGIVHKSGEVIPSICNLRIIKKKGKPQFIEGVARDITELQKTADQLQKSKELAERSLKIKEHFLANMSHEIKTPLNGIIGSLHLMDEENLNDANKTYFHSIKSSTNILLEVLNDLLDISKIEAGKMELNNTVVTTAQLFKKLKTLYQAEANQKGIKLSFEIDSNVPKNILGDDIKLTQIFSNLISNALKFTPRDGIIIAQLELKKIKKNGILKIKGSVKDTGIGIHTNDKKRLFKSFEQLDNSSSKPFKGTGLGLFISKKLAKLMKGSIGVKSDGTSGSKFWFTFETIETSPLSATKEENENIRLTNNPKILVVDDNQVNLQIASVILRQAGGEISEANSGEMAIELASEKKYDLILMDIQMPGMDGLEATKQIKSGVKNHETPILAMTAYSLKGDREKFLSAGMDGFIPKPIKPNSILNTVKEWTGESLGTQKHREIKTLLDDKLVINGNVLNSLKKYGGDELIRESLKQYDKECKKQLDQCFLLESSGDFEEILVILHTLKGNAGTLGIEKMSYCAEYMENEVKKKNYNNFNTNLKELASLHQEFRIAIQKL